MNHIVGTLMMMALAASLAEAQSSAGGSAQGQAAGSAVANGAGASGNAQVTLAASASADASALKDRIETKAAKTSARARAKAEAKLEATADQVDAEAKDSEAKVARRLSAEFDMTTDALIDQKSTLEASWGDLMIAHTLDASTRTDVTVDQLVTMHEDGMGWGDIAAGLGLDLGEVVSAVRTEAKVAGGQLAADGKVAVAHASGAQVGAGAGLKTSAATQAGGAKVDASAGVGLGVKIKP